MVVNNNAAAVLLVLAALARDRSVLVSRGELIEIGGGFRIPEILAESGARLVEVGTTNRTRLDDYERACADDVALVLKVHTSNYRMIGFVASTSVAELAEPPARRRVRGRRRRFRPPRRDDAVASDPAHMAAAVSSGCASASTRARRS